MENIKVEKKLSPEVLKKRGVFDWPLWEKEISKFPWVYNQEEKCYITEGEAEIIMENEVVVIKAGDFVTFKKGLECTWNIIADIKKHYNFS